MLQMQLILNHFSAATAEDKQQVEQAINSSVNLVPFGLSASDWKVHRGDLVVEGNIESNQKLIVLGNLTVKVIFPLSLFLIHGLFSVT